MSWWEMGLAGSQKTKLNITMRWPKRKISAIADRGGMHHRYATRISNQEHGCARPTAA
jgi:hypothetical protein